MKAGRLTTHVTCIRHSFYENQRHCIFSTPYSRRDLASVPTAAWGPKGDGGNVDPRNILIDLVDAVNT